MEVIFEYDPRYLEGIVCFNQQDFFEAHEVWEELWQATNGSDRRFYQGLIQAAVAIYHASNGNWRGSRRLFVSGRKYMQAYPNPHLGLNHFLFWSRLETALASFLNEEEPNCLQVRWEDVPKIVLQPEPTHWPNPDGNSQAIE